jgi:ribosomal protein S1
VGSTLTNCKVAREVYGGSFEVTSKQGAGFLHKTHQKQPEDSEEERKELKVGQALDRVKVKELNYFDGCPILSLKDSLLGQQVLNYHQIKAGQFLKAKVAKAHPEKGLVVLQVNDFIQGHLHLEHMADQPIRVIPPKLLEQGRETTVRVLKVNASERFIEFTKKDSLMKEDVPVVASFKEVKQG